MDARKLNISWMKVFWAALLLASSLPVSAKTMAGGGAQFGLERRSTWLKQMSGWQAGFHGFTETGFFPGNIGMTIDFNWSAGNFKTTTGNRYDYGSLSLWNMFKYYVPVDLNIGSWYKKYVYKVMDRINPFFGVALGLKVDTEMRYVKTGIDEYARETDVMAGGQFGFNIIAWKDLVVVTKFLYARNLMADDSDDPLDDRAVYGHLFQAVVAAGYMFDL